MPLRPEFATPPALRDEPPARSPPPTRTLIALAIASAVALAAPALTERFEGYRGAAYLDPAKILTQCYGETEGVDPERIYSQGECAAKLRKRMTADYAPRVIACVPSFVEPDNAAAFAAALDASYNAGPAAVCKSPMAAAFNRRAARAGCDAFRGWYTSARNRRTGVRVVYPGLVRRREAERALCLKGAG